jgi:tRNA A-37 threonylcarbamoyl transferase component Bud32
MFKKETHQSTIFFEDSTVKKVYRYKNHKKNKLSSVKNEIYCIKKFAKKNKKYTPIIYNFDDISYTMKRYDFGLGNTKRISEKNVRRMLFSCSFKNIIKQLEEIEQILKNKDITHKDINPGNLLFSESEKSLKLIDFYWASTDNINLEYIPGINGIYGVDKNAFQKIKKQIKNIHKQILKEVDKSKIIISKLGETKCEGSSKHIGKTYHPIDINYYVKDNKFHKDISYEYNNIISNIKNPIHSFLDIGCAAGYYTFNFLRRFNIKNANAYEADPVMLKFLKSIKNIFYLSEINFNDEITPKTKFNKVDLTICMNVHMWFEKKYGKKSDIIISNLIENSKEMFFQTAGKESSGIYKVDWLKTKDDIKKYLEDLGGKNVEYIDKSKRGGKRYLFKIGD